MAGFADLVGRNAPALLVKRAVYVAGDTWGGTVGPFADDANTVINLASATINIRIWDRPGGTQIGSNFTGTGTNAGTFTFTIPSANTANLAIAGQARRELAWSCDMTSGGSTVTVWSAVESPLAVLSD